VPGAMSTQGGVPFKLCLSGDFDVRACHRHAPRGQVPCANPFAIDVEIGVTAETGHVPSIPGPKVMLAGFTCGIARR
jgi:hypothetical protein